MTMDLDILLERFFGTADLDTLSDQDIAEGAERVRIAFATEQEPGRRFALWAVLHGLDDAPEPEAAFKDEPELQEAAREYLRAMWLAQREQD